jgi:hypothetical protein
MSDAATRVTVSYPADLSDWGRDMVDRREFRAYLRKVYDELQAGDAWDEFVGVGCCGSSLDVPLVVESVEGGTRLTDDTDIEFSVREACDVRGSWQVQSQGGPRTAQDVDD